MQELVAGAGDIAIGGFPALAGGIKAQTLFRETYVCVMRRDHPARRTSFDLQAFQDCDHIVVAAPEIGHVDRKSVVEGKSVSVRVDLGGSRIIKKNRRDTNIRSLHT